MVEEQDGVVQRWAVKRPAMLVLKVLKVLRGETSVPKADRSYGLTVAEVEVWRVGI